MKVLWAQFLTIEELNKFVVYAELKRADVISITYRLTCAFDNHHIIYYWGE